MSFYAPSARLSPSYPYAPPGLTSPRDRYLTALAEVKAAQANYLAAEAAEREEEAPARRLQEIQTRKRENILRSPYQAQSAPRFSELGTYQAVYGPNYLAAYERDHVHTVALAERHALKTTSGRCPCDEFVSNNLSTLNPNLTSLNNVQVPSPYSNGVIDSRPSYLSISPFVPKPRANSRAKSLLNTEVLFDLFHPGGPRRIPQPPTSPLPSGPLARAVGAPLTGLQPPPRPSREAVSEAEFERQFAELFRVHDTRGGTALRPVRLTPAPAPPAHMGASSPAVRDNAAEDEQETLRTATAAAEAEIERQFAGLLRMPDTRGRPSLPPIKLAPVPAPLTREETTKPTVPAKSTQDVPDTLPTAATAQINSSFAKIRAIASALTTLNDNFTLAAELDFLAPTPSSPSPSSSSSDSATEHLSYSPRNRAVRSYEDALTVLLTQLDSVESLGHAGVRASRKEVVGRVEKALEELERALEGRWRITVRKSEVVEDGVPELKLDSTGRALDDASSASPEEVRIDETKNVLFPSEPVVELNTSSLDTMPTDGAGVPLDITSINTEPVVTEVEEPTAVIDAPAESTIPPSYASIIATVLDADDDDDDLTDAETVVTTVVDNPTETSAPSIPGPSPSDAPLDISSVASPTTDLESPAVLASDLGPSPSENELAVQGVDAFLLTPSLEENTIKPNVKDDEEEWLEVDA
ncbi:hypothetical protein DXG01_008768 [Tephrocybe rancida]|nr:hypothetical protein DXG01_008768 [Tephrocybe rancida]